MSNCDHKYVYGGVKYKVDHSVLSHGARPINYYDWFYCEKCLHNTYNLLVHATTTYSKPDFNATPMGYDEAATT